MIRQTHRPISSRQLYLATAATALFAWSSPADALPMGGVIPSGGGSATFDTSIANSLTVNQASNRVVIDWNKFNIGGNEHVTFAQPDKGSIAFNVVPASAGVTTIAGSLNANGGVWLFSPAGIIFGSGATVTTGSFLASTGIFNSTSQTEAMSGANTIDIFPQATPGQGAITVQGAFSNGSMTINAASIGADAGFVLLHAPTITQDGCVTASDAVVYNADEDVQATFVPTNSNGASGGITLTSETSDPGLPSASHIVVGGSTSAGTWFEADAAEDVTTSPGYGGVINLSGTITATGMKADTANPNDAGNGFSVILNGDDGGPSSAEVTTINASGSTITASSGIYANAGSISTGAWTSNGGAVQLSAGGAGGIDVDPPLISTGPGLVSLIGQSVTLDSDVTAAGSVLVLSHDVTVGPGVDVEAGKSIADSSLIIKSTGDIIADPSSELFVGPALGTPTGALSVLAGATVGPQDSSLISQTNLGTGGDLTLGYANGSTVTLQATPLNGVGGTLDIENSVDASGSVFMSAAQLTLGANAGIASGLSGSVIAPGEIFSGSGTTDVVLQNAATPGPIPAGAGDILLGAPVNFASPDETLSLVADHSIIVSGAINVSGSGSQVDLDSDFGGAGGDYSFVNGGSLSFTAGDGSQSLFINGNQYGLIYSQADLLNINNNLNGLYALATPLDFAAGNTATVFTGAPVASTTYAQFTGTFTGLGNTISNLNIQEVTPIGQSTPDGGGTNGAIGLFGFVGSGGLVRDLNLSNASVTGGDGIRAGALVGNLDGTVMNVSSSGQVTVGSDTFASTGQDNGDFAQALAGGLAGFSDGQIINAHSSATVMGGQAAAGGLVGQLANLGSIANSSAAGAVTVDGVNPIAGGLVGAALNSVTITGSSASGAVSGGDNSTVGGLVGELEFGSSATGSFATGATNAGANSEAGGFAGLVLESSIDTSYATGAVTQTVAGSDGIPDIAGGFVGYLGYYSSATQSYSTGAVQTVGGQDSGADTLAGGFAGEIDSSSSVSAAYSLGAVTSTTTAYADVGGFAGLVQNSSSVSQVYATGLVSGFAGSTTAGLVAVLGDNNEGTPVSSLSNSYWDTGTTGQSFGYHITPAAMGYNPATANAVTGITGSGVYSAATYANFNFTSTWTLIPGVTRPLLQSEYSTTITNAHQLQLMEMDLGADYTLANDIDASGTSAAAGTAGGLWNPATGFSPVGGNAEAAFTGTFNGQGYTISSLTIKFTTADPQTPFPSLTTDGLVGLFGFVGPTGVVENVNLASAQVTAGDGMLAGALVGGLLGSVTNASSSGVVTVGNEIDTGDGITADGGGLVGGASGSISNSHSSAIVTGGDAFVGGLLGTGGETASIVDSYATGPVSVGAYGGIDVPSAGGLVGNLGDTSGTLAVAGSFATGDVSGGAGAEIGGLIGQLNDGVVTTSYATGNVLQTVGGVAGSSADAGGFVGDVDNGAQITQSYASGDVSSVAAASSGASTRAGGFAGAIESSGTNVSDSYALGSVSVTGSGGGFSAAGGFVGAIDDEGSANGLYAAGQVFGPSINVGGLAGQVGAVGGGMEGSGSISDSYWDEGPTNQTTGVNLFGAGTQAANNPVGGVSGHSAYATASYSNFDFIGTWFMVAGSTRPILQSEYSTDITNAHQLQLMDMNLAADYTLGNDINAAATGGASDIWNPATGFSPIGATADSPFTGTFNGQGHTISNLTVIDTTTVHQDDSFGNPSDGAAGLFGFVVSNGVSSGVLENVNLANANVSGGDGMEVGALAGDVAGTVTNASSSGHVSVGDGDDEFDAVARAGGLVGDLTGAIQNSSSSAMVTGGQASIGGLIGEVEGGTVTGSFATGAVNGGADSIAGGFVGAFLGESSGMITTSYATGGVTQSAGVDDGDIAGGFAGEVSGGHVSQSFSSGVVTVTGSETIPAFVGGFVGAVENDGEVTDAYSTSPVTVTGSTFDNVGGFAGEIFDTSSATNVLATGAVSATGHVGGLVGSLDEDATVNNGYWDEGTTGQQYGIASNDGHANNVVGMGGESGVDPFDPATYSGSFDFTNIWSPPSAGEYPQLYGVSHVMLLTAQNTDITYGNYPVYMINITGLQGGDPASVVQTINALPLDTGIANSGYYDVAYTNPTPPDGVPPPYTLAPSASGATGGTGAYRIVLNDGGTAATSAGLVAGTLEVDPASVEFDPVGDSKTYDGTTGDGQTPNYCCLVPGDTASPTQSFNSPNVVDASSLSVDPESAIVDDGNNGSNYNVTFGDPAPGSITPAPLTVSLSETDKVYDTTNAATGITSDQYTLSGVVNDEDVELSSDLPTTGTYDGVNAGTHAVTVTGVNLTGSADLSNYSFNNEATGPGQITPAPLTITAATDDRQYDGDIDSSGIPTVGSTPGVDGLYTSDTIAGLRQSYVSKNVMGTGGSTLAVNQTGFTITDSDGGNGLGNYNITYDTMPGTITPAPLVLTAAFNEKTYDGGVTAAATPTVGTTPGVNGLYSGDSISGQTESYTSKDVNPTGNTLAVDPGSYTISDANGPDGENYSVSFVNAAGIIDPLALTASLTGTVEKTYNTTTDANLAANNYSLSTPISGDDVSLVAPTGPAGGTYDNPNAGTGKTVTVTGLQLTGDEAEDYSVNSTAAGPVGIIDPAPLTITAATDDRQYDGDIDSSGIPTVGSTPGVDGLYTSDTIAGLSQSYVSKNVMGTGGSTLAVNQTGFTITDSDGGNGLGNYNITYDTMPGTITPAPLVLTAAFNEKTYDGGVTAAATPTVGTTPGVNGLYSGDSISGQTESYTSKDVNPTGNTLAVDPGSYTISDANGPDGENYSVSFVNAAGIIDPLALTASLTGTVEKVYDGTTTATLNSDNYSLPGVIGEDDVSLNDPTSGTYNNRNAGTGKTATVVGLQLGGDDSEDYSLSSTTASGAVGIITPAPLTLTAVTDTRTYNGGVTSSGTPTNSALVEGDSISNKTQSFASKNVLGTGGSTLVVTGYTIDDGNDGANYTVTLVSAHGTINPAPLTIAAVTDEKTYDSTTAATVAPDPVGLVGGDSLSATETFDSKDAGARTLAVSGYTISDGNNGGNYIVTTTTAGGTIDPKALTASLVGSVSKPFDGNASATLASGNYSLSGVISGDSVSLNDPTSGMYDNANAGTDKLVTVSGLALSGDDAANYIVNGAAAANIGTITAAPQPIVIKLPPTDLITPDFEQAAASVAGSTANDTTVVDVFPVGSQSPEQEAVGDSSPITGAGNRDLWTSSDESDKTCPPNTSCPTNGGTAP